MELFFFTEEEMIRLYKPNSLELLKRDCFNECMEESGGMRKFASIVIICFGSRNNDSNAGFFEETSTFMIPSFNEIIYLSSVLL